MHRWDVTVKEAAAIQEQLRDSVALVPLKSPPNTIAGADISFGRFSNRFFACVAVFSYPRLELLEDAYAEMHVTFPYVPGYLSFREVPAIETAYRTLKIRPDVLMMDGHGIAHPRRIGVASHLGLVLDMPVFGCAKSLLFGVGEPPQAQKGSVSYMYDPNMPRDVIGARVRTKDDVAPVIVSPGHRITLQESVELALGCARAHRIPEPTRLAHLLVNAYRTRAAADGAY